MLGPVLFGFKILFLVLLYLFIFIIVRRLARDLSRGAEPAAIPSKPSAAAPSHQRSRAPKPAPAAPVVASGGTREFEDLVTRIQPRLVVQHSKVIENGLIFNLRDGATIGRSADSDIVLPDEFVSQTHARLFPRKQFFILEDLGSLNGTFVDGRRLEGEHQIKPGQEVVIGDTIFRYEE